MLKKFSYSVAFLAVSLVSIGVTAGVMGALGARGKGSGPAWTDHPNALKIQQPTVLTKHELFSEDHTADAFAIEQVWAAYCYANDSHNGPLMASLFTPHAIVHFLWVNLIQGGKVVNSMDAFVPHFGIVAPGDETKRMTPEGQLGSGCVLHGRPQIIQYYGTNRQPVLPWPGHSHHETTNMLVKVGDDGKTAVFSAPNIITNVDDKGVVHVSTGGYRAFYEKTPEGWEVVELYGFIDHPSVTKGCDLNGPFPTK